MKPLKKILVIFGTRPEAIKLAPVIKKIRERNNFFKIKICSTGQHKQLLKRVLKIFSLKANYELNIMQQEQNLTDLTARILLSLQPVIKDYSPDLLLVQGDTTTAFAAALVGFYNKIKVAHIEAGLRSHDKYSPYPEEINRKFIDALADIHFAPTGTAKNNLLKEGVTKSKIFVTGNTVVDALKVIENKWQVRKSKEIRRVSAFIASALKSKKDKLLLVTCHRRENFGSGIKNICAAIKEIANTVPNVIFVYPVHLNPNVRKPVYRILGGLKRIHLIEPLDYEAFLYLLKKSFLVITDSGGVQEEAPSFGKPVLVIREKSERHEGIYQGSAKIIGTKQKGILATVKKLLEDVREYKKMIPHKNPYGDGKAAEKIVKVLKEICLG